MDTLSLSLLQQTHATLRRCSQFNDSISLKALFVTDELRPFRDNLPDATNKSDRVSHTVGYLLDQTRTDGQSVFFAFLRTLRDQYPIDNALHGDIAALIDAVSQERSTPGKSTGSKTSGSAADRGTVSTAPVGSDRCDTDRKKEEQRLMLESRSTPLDSRFDAFISYSHRDKEWVHSRLLPRLEQEGLTACVDTRDFEIGVPSLVNMENAVQQSRKTLLVLTPDWVASEWTDFEALLIQTKDPVGRGRRLLPLMVRDCKLPDRLQIFTYLDLRDLANFDFQMYRLVEAIREAGRRPPSLPKPFADSNRVSVAKVSGTTLSYERGLERLADLLANADVETTLNFSVLEARLRDNLRSEYLYGSAETLRHERGQIIEELNRLALKVSDHRFNALCIDQV